MVFVLVYGEGAKRRSRIKKGGDAMGDKEERKKGTDVTKSYQQGVDKFLLDGKEGRRKFSWSDETG